MIKTLYLNTLLKSLIITALISTTNILLAFDHQLDKEARPNRIIFILSDDHRYDYMGFMGAVEWLETPNMDRLAREGSHCSEAFVTTSLCSPSRATILTGLYTHQHTIVETKLRTLVFILFPKHLQDANKTLLKMAWAMTE